MKRKGFYSIEALIAIVLMSMLSAMAIFIFDNGKIPATTSSMRSDLRNIINIINSYKIINGTYSGIEGTYEDLNNNGFAEKLIGKRKIPISKENYIKVNTFNCLNKNDICYYATVYNDYILDKQGKVLTYNNDKLGIIKLLTTQEESELNN